MIRKGDEVAFCGICLKFWTKDLETDPYPCVPTGHVKVEAVCTHSPVHELDVDAQYDEDTTAGKEKLDAGAT